MKCVKLTKLPEYEQVRRILGDRNPESADVWYPCYERQLGQLRAQVQPVAYVKRVTADETLAGYGIAVGCELLAVVLTLGRAGADEVRRLCTHGEHLDALVSDALQSAWLFAADRELQERLRVWCEAKHFGIGARLEAFEQLPGEAQRWICGQFSGEPDFGVRITAGGMLYPEKSMCYLLRLDQDCSRFAAGHDCAHCSKTDCGMRQETAKETEIENAVAMGRGVVCRKNRYRSS